MEFKDLFEKYKKELESDDSLTRDKNMEDLFDDIVLSFLEKQLEILRISLDEENGTK